MVLLTNCDLIKIGIIPATWHLSREFIYENKNGVSSFRVSDKIPKTENAIKRTKQNEWLITLKWSHESIAQIAYELTFWYMGKLGERIFTNEKGKPNMATNYTGKNAAKERLYFSINRCRTSKEKQRAIALFNTYCFGYALGMNYKNEKGKREMLFIETLKEIYEKGVDRFKCKIY